MAEKRLRHAAKELNGGSLGMELIARGAMLGSAALILTRTIHQDDS